MPPCSISARTVSAPVRVLPKPRPASSSQTIQSSSVGGSCSLRAFWLQSHRSVASDIRAFSIRPCSSSMSSDKIKFSKDASIEFVFINLWKIDVASIGLATAFPLLLAQANDQQGQGVEAVDHAVASSQQ